MAVAHLATTSGPDCTLHLLASDLAAAGPGEVAGRLQAELAAFLRTCPHGTVIIDRFQELPASGLLALHTALSEGGSFQLDGHTVPSHLANYVLAYTPSGAVQEPGVGVEGASDGAAASGERPQPPVMAAQLLQLASSDDAAFEAAAKSQMLAEFALQQQHSQDELIGGFKLDTLLAAFRRRIDIVLPVVSFEEAAQLLREAEELLREAEQLLKEQ